MSRREHNFRICVVTRTNIIGVAVGSEVYELSDLWQSEGSKLLIML